MIVIGVYSSVREVVGAKFFVSLSCVVYEKEIKKKKTGALNIRRKRRNIQ